MASVTATWTPNAAAEGVTKYRLYQDGALVGEPTASTFTVQNVTPGVHSYQVSAVNVWGETAKSAAVATPPGASVPSGLTITINVSVTV